MSTSLQKIDIGIAGEQPDLYLFVTDYASSEILVPGFMNKQEFASAQNLSNKSFLFTYCTDGNFLFTASIAANGVITLESVNTPSPLNSRAYYVDGVNGSDISGNGTLENPYETIQFAVDAAEATTPTEKINIYIAPMALPYEENVLISSPYINLVGPTASIYAGSGAALTINAAGGDTTVILSSLGATGANTSLALVGSHSLLANINNLYGGAVTSADGVIAINASFISGSLSATGAGSIFYSAGKRLGADGNEVTGVSADGAKTESFDVAGVLSQDDNSAVVTKIVNVTSATLASGGVVPAVVNDGSAQYRINDIKLNFGGTDFSGGGGDRLLAVKTDTVTYTVIPAAALQSLVNARWGDTEVPAPVSVGWDQIAAVGEDIYLEYSGGTTDYTAGSANLSIDYIREA